MFHFRELESEERGQGGEARLHESKILCDSGRDRESIEKLYLREDRLLYFGSDTFNQLRFIPYTDKKHQPVCRCFLGFYAVLAHAMNDWANEVDREDAIDVS